MATASTLAQITATLTALEPFAADPRVEALLVRIRARLRKGLAQIELPTVAPAPVQPAPAPAKGGKGSAKPVSPPPAPAPEPAAPKPAPTGAMKRAIALHKALKAREAAGTLTREARLVIERLGRTDLDAAEMAAIEAGADLALTQSAPAIRAEFANV